MKKRTNIFIIIFFVLLSAICLIPFLYVTSASFTDEAALQEFGYKLIPSKFSLSAYKMIMRQGETILNSYAITIATTVIGTVLSLFLQASYGYVLSRKDYAYVNTLGKYLYFTMIFSGGMIPLYLLITQVLHLKDTFWVLILPLLGGGGNIYMLRNFFKQMPYSLIESAKLDGANEFSIFFKIALPITKTGLATVAVFLVLTFWNEWFSSMMYMTNEKYVTLQYLLTKLISNVTFFRIKDSMAGGMMSEETLPTETLRMATVIVVVGPMLCVFPFFQKYFVRGLTVGAVKG